MTAIPEGAIPAKNGGWIKPFTKETRRAVGRTRNIWKPPPNPESGYGAVWYRNQHALALKLAHIASPADATRLAEDKIVSQLIAFLAQQLNAPADYSCPKCGVRSDQTSKLMVVGASHIGRVHQRCMMPLLDDLERRAREIWVRLMSSTRRAPP